MIEYSFGENKCKLDWNNFLCVTENDVKAYKSDFKDFAEFYEYIDTLKNNISHILFDGYEYFLENGVLHNLYGPAIIKIASVDGKFTPKGTKSYSFYIKGKLVHDQLDDRGCRKMEDFEKNEIFFWKRLTDKISGKDTNTGIYHRTKAGIDYIKTPINLQNLRLLDQRKKKLKQISDSNERI